MPAHGPISSLCPMSFFPGIGWRVAARRAKKLLGEIEDADFPVSGEVLGGCPPGATAYDRAAGATRVLGGIVRRYTVTGGRTQQESHPKLHEVVPVPKNTMTVILGCDHFLTWWAARVRFAFVKEQEKFLGENADMSSAANALEAVFKTAFSVSEKRAELEARKKKEKAHLLEMESPAAQETIETAIDNAHWQRGGNYNEAQAIMRMIDAHNSDLVKCAAQYFNKEACQNRADLRSHTWSLYDGMIKERERKIATLGSLVEALDDSLRVERNKLGGICKAAREHLAAVIEGCGSSELRLPDEYADHGNVAPAANPNDPRQQSGVAGGRAREESEKNASAGHELVTKAKIARLESPEVAACVEQFVNSADHEAFYNTAERIAIGYLRMTENEFKFGHAYRFLGPVCADKEAFREKVREMSICHLRTLRASIGEASRREDPEAPKLAPNEGEQVVDGGPQPSALLNALRNRVSDLKSDEVTQLVSARIEKMAPGYNTAVAISRIFCIDPKDFRERYGDNFKMAKTLGCNESVTFNENVTRMRLAALASAQEAVSKEELRAGNGPQRILRPADESPAAQIAAKLAAVIAAKDEIRQTVAGSKASAFYNAAQQIAKKIFISPEGFRSVYGDTFKAKFCRDDATFRMAVEDMVSSQQNLLEAELGRSRQGEMEMLRSVRGELGGGATAPFGGSTARSLALSTNGGEVGGSGPTYLGNEPDEKAEPATGGPVTEAAACVPVEGRVQVDDDAMDVDSEPVGEAAYVEMNEVPMPPIGEVLGEAATPLSVGEGAVGSGGVNTGNESDGYAELADCDSDLDVASKVGSLAGATESDAGGMAPVAAEPQGERGGIAEALVDVPEDAFLCANAFLGVKWTSEASKRMPQVGAQVQSLSSLLSKLRQEAAAESCWAPPEATPGRRGRKRKLIFPECAQELSDSAKSLLRDSQMTLNPPDSARFVERVATLCALLRIAQKGVKDAINRAKTRVNALKKNAKVGSYPDPADPRNIEVFACSRMLRSSLDECEAMIDEHAGMQKGWQPRHLRFLCAALRCPSFDVLRLNTLIEDFNVIKGDPRDFASAKRSLLEELCRSLPVIGLWNRKVDEASICLAGRCHRWLPLVLNPQEFGGPEDAEDYESDNEPSGDDGANAQGGEGEALVAAGADGRSAERPWGKRGPVPWSRRKECGEVILNFISNFFSRHASVQLNDTHRLSSQTEVMTSQLGALSLAIEEELGYAIKKDALRNMFAKKRQGGVSKLNRQARGDLDIRLAKPKKSLSKPHPRNPSASINIRYREQLFALLQAFGVPAAWFCMDCMAKVPMVVNARSCTRMKWMLTEDPVKVQDHDFAIGRRLLATVSGLVELGVKRPGEWTAGQKGDGVVAKLKELILRNENYPTTKKATVYLRGYRYDPVTAGSHVRDVYNKLQSGGQIGAVSALFLSIDNGPDYTVDNAVTIHLYGRLWRAVGPILLSVSAHAPYWSRKHYQVEQTWGPLRTRLEGVNLGLRGGETWESAGKTEDDYRRISEDALVDLAAICRGCTAGGVGWEAIRVRAAEKCDHAAFPDADVDALRDFYNGTQKAMKAAPELLKEAADLLGHCFRRPHDMAFVACDPDGGCTRCREMYGATQHGGDKFGCISSMMESDLGPDGKVVKMRPPRPVEKDEGGGGGGLKKREELDQWGGRSRVVFTPWIQGEPKKEYIQFVDYLEAVTSGGMVTTEDRIPYVEGREALAHCGQCDVVTRGAADKKRNDTAHALFGAARGERPAQKKRGPPEVRDLSDDGQCAFPPGTQPVFGKNDAGAKKKRKAGAGGAAGEGAKLRVRRDFTLDEPLVDLKADEKELTWLAGTCRWRVAVSAKTCHFFSLLGGAKIPPKCAKNLTQCLHKRHQAFAQEARKRAIRWMADPAVDPVDDLRVVPAEFQLVPIEEEETNVEVDCEELGEEF